MILKIGIDLVENARMKKYSEDESFINRILSKKEKERFDLLLNQDRKIEYLAGRFASKEAYIKALPNGFTFENYGNIDVLNDELGAPFIKVKDFPHIIHLSISHTSEYTIAFVVIEES